MFCKSIIKKPYMFRSLLYDHPQELSFVLSAFTTFPLLASRFEKYKEHVHKFHANQYLYVLKASKAVMYGLEIQTF
jgi:hypothetical protein